MIVTRHAVRRFRERIRPGADEREARTVLSNAHYRWTKVRRIDKRDTLWRVDVPAMILVVRHDPKDGQVIVSVWPEEFLLSGEAEDL